MLKFIHNVALFLSLIFLNACAYQYSSQLNTKDLADDEKTLGVFVVRPMYFDKVEHANYFVLSEILGLKTKKKVRLTVKNRLSLSATGPSDINVSMYHQHAFSGVQSKFINRPLSKLIHINSKL